jgi:hypothetical protein
VSLLLTTLALKLVGIINSTQGPIIGLFHQYAHIGTGNIIHATNQLHHFGIEGDD